MGGSDGASRQMFHFRLRISFAIGLSAVFVAASDRRGSIAIGQSAAQRSSVGLRGSYAMQAAEKKTRLCAS